MKFTFSLTPYESADLLAQAARALEKRTELVSRAQYPGLWARTDRLGGPKQSPQPSRLRTRLLSTVCLVLGIVLFVPGLMQPKELLVPLLMGAVGIGAGIGGFYRSRKNKKTAFERSAERLLAPLRELEDGLRICFSEEGMQLSEEETVPYDGFEYVIETEELLLLTYDARVSVLKKDDLTDADPAELASFLSERTNYHCIAQ